MKLETRNLDKANSDQLAQLMKLIADGILIGHSDASKVRGQGTSEYWKRYNALIEKGKTRTQALKLASKRE